MILYNINYVCTADTRVDGKQLWWNNESIISTTCQSLTGFISVGSFKLGLVSFQKVLGQVSLWLCRLHWQLRWYLKLAWLIMISIEILTYVWELRLEKLWKISRQPLIFPGPFDSTTKAILTVTINYLLIWGIAFWTMAFRGLTDMISCMRFS